MSGLSVSGLIRVTINLSPTAARRRSFSVLMVAGDSEVINPTERVRTFTGYESVALAFGAEAPEALAASVYFGQSPKPATMMVGRWVRTASAALNIGGLLTASQQTISNWTAIASGGFSVTIDGVAKNLTGLDFTGVTNLNGVASVINGSLTGGVASWDGTKFQIKSNTTGAGVKATGTVSFDVNPNNNDTLTLNGTVITFKSSSPTGSQVLIGSTKEATAANLQLFLNATVVSGLLTADYSTAAEVLTIEYKTVGTGGNAYTLAESTSGARIVVSGASLAGGAVPSSVGYATAPGSGTDISTLLRLTSATSLALIDGYDAETPAECVAALANISSNWYGLMFAASVQPTDDQAMAVSAQVEAFDLKRMFGSTIIDSDVLSSLVTDDLASRQKDAGYLRSFTQYSSANAYAVASIFGRMFTVDFDGENTTINLMYKQEPGVTAEVLTEEQSAVLESKRCNVFVAYVNDTSILQFGTVAGPAFLDEIHGIDWLGDAAQNAAYNTLYLSNKIAQTDPGVNKLVNAIDGVMGQAVRNGLVAPGVWTSALEFGQLKTGDYLKSGYYIYATPVALQSQAARDAREAPPIQTAARFAGAINRVLDIGIDFVR